jgi:hypothetical protein
LLNIQHQTTKQQKVYVTTSVVEFMYLVALGRLAAAIKNNHPPVMKYKTFFTTSSEATIVSNIGILLIFLYSPKARVFVFWV